MLPYALYNLAVINHALKPFLNLKIKWTLRHLLQKPLLLIAVLDSFGCSKVEVHRLLEHFEKLLEVLASHDAAFDKISYLLRLIE